MVRRKPEPSRGGPYGASTSSPQSTLKRGVITRSRHQYIPQREVEAHDQPHSDPENDVQTPEKRFSRSSLLLQGSESSTRQVKRKRTTKPGYKALKEIRKYQRSTQLVIPKIPFVRLIKEILMTVSRETNVSRIERSAVEALQEAAEMVIVQLFEDGMLCAVHAKRVTLLSRDIHLVLRLTGTRVFGTN
ncbi:histone H3-3-like isoform X1 [Schistocerca gregaria]|uniref:histone H3-3-like isoform X1 n=1 Tax=Schistocerca gregaria TaxID=7010 RepID=UPI00211DEE09|nr:histone H3-3-like isoform X1 [Schistocerca gregaria]